MSGKELPSYCRQTIDNPNPLARFAHRSRIGMATDLVVTMLPTNGSFLDFGSGDGSLLRAVRLRRPDATLIGVEPYMTHPTSEDISFVGDLAVVPRGSVFCLAAFETLEHLDDDEIEKFLVDAGAALSAGGVLLISVPIMVGLALPAKEISRMMLFRRRSDYSLPEMVRGTFGQAVPRASNRRVSHHGFDFRQLVHQISSAFEIERTILSPMASFPWWINSQLFIVASRRL